MTTLTPNSEADGKFPYRWCIVAKCMSSSVNTPEKLWIELPNDLDTRNKWLHRATIDRNKFPTSSPVCFCEDHFDLENDLENYEQYKATGSVKDVKMKPNCVPTRFECRTNTQATASGVTSIRPQIKICTVSQPMTQRVGLLEPSKTPFLVTHPPEDDHVTEGSHACLSADVSDIASVATLFCLCCLQRGVPYVRLVTCVHAEFLHSMMMPEIKPKNQVVCYECHHMLKKIKLFKEQVEESFKLLSDSTETTPNHINNKRNFKIRQNFNISIPQKNSKIKPARIYTENPHRQIKISTDLDEKIKKDKEKRVKMIKEALRIINNNQNNNCINALTNSLQNISTDLLSELMNPNFDVGSLNDSALTPEISKDNEIGIVTTLKEELIDAKEAIAFKNDSNDIVNKITVSPNKITNTLGEKAFKIDTANKLTEIFLSENAIKTEVDENVAIRTENLAKVTEEDAKKIEPTNNYIKTTPITPEDICKGVLPMPLKDIENSTKATKEFIGRLITEKFSKVDHIPGEELKQPVEVKEKSVGADQGGLTVIKKENDESQEPVGGGENDVQVVKPAIALGTRPSLGEHIKQLTLTRRELLEERAKIATSPVYLRAPHKCISCLISFQFCENLKDHNKRKHISLKPQSVQCDVCHQFVDTGASYDMHTFWHHTRYQCVACSQRFASYDKAALHYRKQHQWGHRVSPRSLLKCPRCDYKTWRHRLLKNHMAHCRPVETAVSVETDMTNLTEAPSEAKRAKLTQAA